MKTNRRALLFAFLAASLLIAPLSFGQPSDSVDVAFSYTNAGVSGVTLVGEFNGWSTTAWPMTDQGNGLWTRTARLPVGVNPFSDPVKGVPGAWQYKFYYPGASEWPNDPLNHHQNPGDNYNTFIITKDPTIYHLLPNQRQPIVSTSTPTITASIFPKVGARLDTSLISVNIDGVTCTGLGAFYDTSARALSYRWPTALTNGSHTMVLTAASTAGAVNADTVTFVTQAGNVQITTHGGYATLNPLRELRGIIQNMSISSVKLVRNGTDTMLVPVTQGVFAAVDTLKEGINTFRVLADSNGVSLLSDPVSITYLVRHAPHAVMGFTKAGSQVVFYADGTTDPDSGETSLLKFLWKVDAGNPSTVAGADGNTLKSFMVTPPTIPGDYFFTLFVTDPEGNADTTRNYFTIEKDGSITIALKTGNPSWARRGRIYFLFPRAVTQNGTLNDAMTKLQYIKNLGFNIVWLMPIMKNASPINNGTGTGYNIVDFYTVAEEYGGNTAFAGFMAQAHALGLKVILDITPNHTSRFHPFCADAHLFKQDSRYWSWYEHRTITSNTNGLGDCLDADGFNYYCGYSDQLMNYNWSDIDARTEMINVYKYWIQQFGVDGYRFDSYWGPDRRYGEVAMGDPLRIALKQIKPDILLLGEDSGTGSGTEVIFADHLSGGVRGGLDAAYDFNLYWNGINNFAFDAASIDRLHASIDNNGFYPGENALFMRYMESQDEDRIVYFYSSVDAQTTFMRTMPVASVLLTAPGLPMIWNGQEVGWGYGINGAKEARSRSVINWDYQGRELLAPHYQKLASIRAQFPAFTQHKQDSNHDGSVNASDAPDFVRLASDNGSVYAFARPYADQNGLTVVNVSSAPQQALLKPVTSGALLFSGGIQQTGSYYLNNVYQNTSQLVQGSSLDSIEVTLPAYGTAIFTVSTTRDTLRILSSILSVPEEKRIPQVFALMQNYPNPFNPSTTIRFDVPCAGAVSLKIYDDLGREVVTLIDQGMTAGSYQLVWNGRNAGGQQVGTGVYFYRLSASQPDGSVGSSTKRMLLLK